MGQNFLKDKNIIKKIIGLIKITNQNLIEIGPGLGALTNEIIKENPKKLILIEKDNKISKILKEKFKDDKRILIFNNDILKMDLSQYKNFSVISNLPYNLSVKIIFKLLNQEIKFNEIILMIQKEVASKLNYNDRNKNNKYKFLIETISKYKICFNVSKNVFYPKPKVESSVIKIIPKKHFYNFKQLDNFSKVIFSQRRKKIKNILNLKNKNTLLENKRSEDLNHKDLIKLFDTF